VLENIKILSIIGNVTSPVANWDPQVRSRWVFMWGPKVRTPSELSWWGPQLRSRPQVKSPSGVSRWDIQVRSPDGLLLQTVDTSLVTLNTDRRMSCTWTEDWRSHRATSLNDGKINTLDLTVVTLLIHSNRQTNKWTLTEPDSCGT